MNITLTDDAIRWFEEKIPLHEGEAVRFFGKIYGNTEAHEGFSLGIQTDKVENYESSLAVTEENGRKYFTAIDDKWFFEGYDLEVRVDEEYKEPSYHFIPQNPEENIKDSDAVSSPSKKK